MNTKIIKQDIQHKHYDAMVIATLPLIVASSILFGPRVILLSIIGLLTARVIDVFASMIFNTELDTSDKSSIVAALVFVLMLPVSIPIHIVIVTIAVTIFIGKHAFGGNGVYPFSLPALAICLAAVNWPEEVFKVVEPFSQVSFWSGASTEFATHTTVIKQGGLPNVSVLDLLLGNYASAMGTSFILLILSIGIYLIVTKRISFTIPACYLLTYAGFSLLFPRIYGISLLDNLMLEMLTSGCVFYAFFVISETALTPKGKLAQGIYGVLAGSLGVLFTHFGAYEIGVCFAILILNAMQRTIDESADLLRLFIKELKDKPKQVKPAKSVEPKVKPAKESKEASLETQKTKEKPQIASTSSEEQLENAIKKAIKEDKEDESNNKSFPIDLIRKAEDDIDEVIFSTQTFSVQELLDETRKSKSNQNQQKAKKPRQQKTTDENQKPKKPRQQKTADENQKAKKPRQAKTADENQKPKKPRQAKTADENQKPKKPRQQKTTDENQKPKKPRTQKPKENNNNEGENE